MNILPGKEQEVLLQDRLNVALAEALADGSAVLVPDDAGWLIEHLPAALPREEAEIGVFQIEGREQLVEPAQLEKLPPVERARPAAPVEAREEAVDLRVFAMAH